MSESPKFISYNRPNPNRPKSRPVAPPRDLNNFPDLAGNKPTPAAASPRFNPWGKPKPTLPPGAAGTVWRSCPPQATRIAPRFRDRGHLIVWRQHPNGDVHPSRR
ncbi:hypothetical protein EVAR_40702_1 [Eumeta japonica]|uniref:Uncharacterized protein n=1 Tax=Eumeta variegata TaxID=151549 RepID=A0A4C1XAM2_EUMVA|nr:hypothetical protein EVAR_40702_1 [Eumeta japonica]